MNREEIEDRILEALESIQDFIDSEECYEDEDSLEVKRLKGRIKELEDLMRDFGLDPDESYSVGDIDWISRHIKTAIGG